MLALPELPIWTVNLAPTLALGLPNCAHYDVHCQWMRICVLAFTSIEDNVVYEPA